VTSDSAIDTDTIVAVATAPGRGGVGVVRLSGPQATSIGHTITGRDRSIEFEPRVATWTRFHDHEGGLLDTGLLLSFPGPASFTGEDVVELQGHGSPVVLDALVQTAVLAGARLARPGEFSERAFLNGKLDLAQAEAVADLINAASRQSARAAIRSLQGDFSRLVNAASDALLRLRVQVEAAIDFPDEDIELLQSAGVRDALAELIDEIRTITARTRAGVRLTEGARVVLVGAPNVGKSSVLNALCGEERAIVTDIAGTTRDLVREQLVLGGVPIELVDTAGLRATDDVIEAEGVRRAGTAAMSADLVLVVHDLGDPSSLAFIRDWIADHWVVSGGATERSVESELPPIALIGNKLDLVSGTVSAQNASEIQGISDKLALTNSEVSPVAMSISAKTGSGVTDLTERLVGLFGGATKSGTDSQERLDITDSYSARSRHLLALAAAAKELAAARTGIADGLGAELVAEFLRHAQDELGSVCGEITTDALLGEIFSSFCIGK